MVQDWKSCRCNSLVGSTPTPSSTYQLRLGIQVTSVFVEPTQHVEMWVLEKNVPVLNLEQAKIVFMSEAALDGLRVWGIKPPVVNLLLSYSQAVEFFQGEPR